MRVSWSGAQFGNAASATGLFDITPGAESQFILGLPNPAFRILNVTVTGASAGNGSFSESDFVLVAFNASGALLDYSRELIGQDLGNGCTFGDFSLACYGGPSGDFNLFAMAPGATPNGTYYFVLTAAGGETLAVTSIAPGVPEPASWAMLIAGFGLVGAAMRRRTIAVTA
ncbi:MAG: hypothetical protein CFE37_00620 [Alphaproteobacteria bacterium PA4]|nr:MAG: hypothetical protein CFE37_00620 [Alphaproteobacteria bacterium PA4]